MFIDLWWGVINIGNDINRVEDYLTYVSYTSRIHSVSLNNVLEWIVGYGWEVFNCL